MKQFLLFTIFFIFILSAQAQVRSEFESLLTDPETYRDGGDGATGYSSGPAFYPTTFNQNYSYWQAGWAISNITDTTTSGYTNLYAAKAGMGHESASYAVGQQNAKAMISPDLTDNPVEGLYLTNGTYSYNSMRDGDNFAKKFGGDSGNDPDFFKLNIRGYKNGDITTDSVEFYLADYRFEDNNEDYILDTWEWVDLTSLGPIDSLIFTLSSSDTSANGINTPLFFCMDNLTVNVVSVFDTPKPLLEIAVFPNPTSDELTIDVETFDNQFLKIEIFNLNGQLIQVFDTKSTELETINVADLKTGNYILKVSSEEKIAVTRFVKF